MVLKHWILPNNHFKTHLFFSIFGWGGPFSAWILVGRVAQTSKLSGEAIWQVSEDPYHTEFVSWRVDHFLFFYFFSTNGGGGQALSGKFHYFFYPSLWFSQESAHIFFLEILILCDKNPLIGSKCIFGAKCIFSPKFIHKKCTFIAKCTFDAQWNLVHSFLLVQTSVLMQSAF